MELNLALTSTHNRHCTVSDGSGQLHRQLLEGFNPRVELKETRSSYSLNIHLPGFRREDVRLEMDNTRTLLIRGQTCLEGLGIVSWTWHLIERSRGRRRPYKIPHNVNVPSITGSFHHGVLHVQMPKLRTNRFSPYHINGSTRNRHCHDGPTEAIPDRALIPEREVRFPDNLMAEANELDGDHVTDHPDSQRLPHCPEQEDECTIFSEQSVGLHVPESSSSDSLSSSRKEEHGDPQNLVEEMNEASTLSQNPQDQHQQHHPPANLCSDPQLKEEDLGEIMEEDIEDPRADEEEKTLQNADEEEKTLQKVDDEGKTLQEADDADNSHSIKSIKSTVEEQEAMRPFNAEALEENSGDKAILPNNLDLICDLHPRRFFSKTNTKILLSVVLSAAALLAARKLMRRL